MTSVQVRVRVLGGLSSCIDKLAGVDQERRGYLKLVATGRMSDEELDEALMELDEARKSAQRELDGITRHWERIEELEWDKEALLDYYESVAPEAPGALRPEKRYRLYKLVRLQVRIHPGYGMEISWAGEEDFSVCENETVSQRYFYRLAGDAVGILWVSISVELTVCPMW